ncbi:hypothetical protein ACUXIL_003342 [Ralstonia pickettii]
MQIRVTVTRGGAQLFSHVYTVTKEGDLEQAVGSALSEARKVASPVSFDYDINIEKVGP